VIQTPIDCSVVLSKAPSPLEDQTFMYSASPITTTLSAGWSSFFKNSELLNCPITSCTLLGNGCSNSYETAYPNGQLSINTSSPFTLTTNKNIPTGFTETVCIQCHNGDDEE
jgi:hypothetical protein